MPAETMLISRFETLLLKRIEHEIEEVMKEEISKCLVETERRVKEKIGQIAISLCHNSIIERSGAELLIRLRFDK